MTNLLEIKDLWVVVDGQELLHGVNLVIPAGEVHTLLGPNGSGKTSLMMAIMGFSVYRVTHGQILFDGQDITDLDITERARLGLSVAQLIHNIVFLEEEAELNLITGCLTKLNVQDGVHYAVSEHYIGKKAKFTNTMVHSWGPEVIVRPCSGTIVAEGGIFVSNYVSLRPARRIESNPQTWLNGAGASAKYTTIILSSAGATIDTGGAVYLNADDTSAELAHRGVCTGGRMYQRGLLIGRARCRAHVDCAGMVVDAKAEGFIESIPGLRGLHPEARMSHEASIGKIAPEQVEYLQSRGMTEREAISMIIRGFLDADIAGLGPELDARIAEIAELAGHGEER